MDETYENENEILNEEDEEEKKKKGKRMAMILIAIVLLAACVEAFMYMSKDARKDKAAEASITGTLTRDVEKIVAQYMEDTYGDGFMSTDDMAALSTLVAEKLVSEGGTGTISLISTETIEEMVRSAIEEYEEGLDGQDGRDGSRGEDGENGADGAEGAEGQAGHLTEADRENIINAVSAIVAADMAKKLSDNDYITKDQLTEYTQYVYTKTAELEKTIASNYSAYQGTVNTLNDLSSKMSSLTDAMSKRADELADLKAEVKGITGNNSSVQAALNNEIANRTAADNTEMNARKAADSAEADARAEADTLEAKARKAADDSEAEARKAADDSILKELSEKLNSATAMANAAVNEMMAKTGDITKDIESLKENISATDDILTAVQTSLSSESEARIKADKALSALIGNNAEELSDSIDNMRRNFDSNLDDVHTLIDGLSTKEALANAEIIKQLRATEEEADEKLENARKEIEEAINSGDTSAAASALSRYIELSSTLSDTVATLCTKITTENEETRTALEEKISVLSSEYNSDLESVYGLYRDLSKSVTERMEAEAALREQADEELKVMIASAGDISGELEARLNEALESKEVEIRENAENINLNRENIATIQNTIEENNKTTNNYITEIRNEMADGTHLYTVTESEYSQSSPEDSAVYLVRPD
ncbi:MAG: hypothetical protein K6E33_01355 [Lachnospiraceae bacterium]|nr:hypothetical protein [Lachnospiraceae bacterium]